MPQGLQVWDAAGNLIIDTSTKVLKRSTVINFTANTTATQTMAIPPDSSFATVTPIPVTSSGDAQIINAEINGSNIEYRARVADGLAYNLHVVFF